MYVVYDKTKQQQYPHNKHSQQFITGAMRLGVSNYSRSGSGSGASLLRIEKICKSLALKHWEQIPPLPT